MWVQQLLVVIMVSAALLFALWRLPGDATRWRYVAWLRRIDARRGPLAWLVRTLEARLQRGGGGCAACGSGRTPRK